jgi:ubiquinone/menaquinone biosynthesis C-methylase UbiE
MLRHAFITLLLLFSLAGCSESEQNYSRDVAWLIEALKLSETSVVADVGAGDGQQALQIANYLGTNGKLYATELGDDALQNLQRIIDIRETENITVLEGHPAKTNLPARCCDAIYMRRVYHHVAQPDSMNLSLFESLKPGGRLAILDFEPSGTEGEPGSRDEGDSHGITTKTLITELTDAGFLQISEVQFDGIYYRVLFQKPTKDL